MNEIFHVKIGGEIVELIVYFYILYILVVGVPTILEKFDDLAVTPKEIYESNDMNMFGCVIVFIICFIFDPLFYIAHFIYWVFHVGRKD